MQRYGYVAGIIAKELELEKRFRGNKKAGSTVKGEYCASSDSPAMTKMGKGQFIRALMREQQERY